MCRRTQARTGNAPLSASSEELTSVERRYLMKFTDSLHGGLNKLAELLEVERIGPQHQAGSDSLLTACTFFKLREAYFTEATNQGDVEKYMGVLYGLGEDGESGNVEPETGRAVS